jgi:hypothetical protein
VQGVLEALLVALEALEGVVVVMAVEAGGEGDGGRDAFGEVLEGFRLIQLGERGKLGFVQEGFGGLEPS